MEEIKGNGIPVNILILILCSIFQALQDYFKLNNKDLLAFEFAILVALEFGLHTPDIDIYAHYQRLLYSS